MRHHPLIIAALVPLVLTLAAPPAAAETIDTTCFTSWWIADASVPIVLDGVPPAPTIVLPLGWRQREGGDDPGVDPDRLVVSVVDADGASHPGALSPLRG